MVIGTAAGWSAWATVALAVELAFFFGCALTVPGAMEVGAASWVFWASLAFALAVAFVVTLPLNRWMRSGGHGHAVVHDGHAQG